MSTEYPLFAVALSPTSFILTTTGQGGRPRWASTFPGAAGKENAGPTIPYRPLLKPRQDIGSTNWGYYLHLLPASQFQCWALILFTLPCSRNTPGHQKQQSINTGFTEMADLFLFYSWDSWKQTGREGAERVIQTSGLLFLVGNIGEKISAHPLKGMCHVLYPLIKNELADNRAKKRLGETTWQRKWWEEVKSQENWERCQSAAE